MIEYNPRDAVAVFPEGDYPAILHDVIEKTSKAGNDMYELTLQVYHGEREMQVKDYIVIPSFLWKLKRIAQAFNAGDVFESGDFDPRKYVEKSLTVTLEVERREGYDERNVVKRYAQRNGSAAPKVQDTAGDDLPF